MTNNNNAPQVEDDETVSIASFAEEHWKMDCVNDEEDSAEEAVPVVSDAAHETNSSTVRETRHDREEEEEEEDDDDDDGYDCYDSDGDAMDYYDYDEDDDDSAYMMDHDQMNLAREIQLTNRFAAEALDDGYYESAALNWRTLLTKLTTSVALSPEPLPFSEQQLEGDTSNNKNNNTSPAHQQTPPGPQDDVDNSTQQRSSDSVMDVYSTLHLTKCRRTSSTSSSRSSSSSSIDPEDEERDVTDFFGCPFQFSYPRDLLRAPKNSNTLMMLSSEQYNVAVVTCLFNLGLCHHLYWDEHRHHLPSLRTALGYYQEAMSLLWTHRGHLATNTTTATTIPKEEGGPFLLLLLAVGVNAVHCHTELHQYPHTQAWQDVQQHLLQRCTPHERATPEYAILQRLYAQSLLPTSAAAA